MNETAQALRQQVPLGALILFSGSSLASWRHTDGKDASWYVEDGELQVRAESGDIVSRELFGDCRLHLEFLCPYMPERSGQQRANSGVYLQGRYEIQILDSWGRTRLGNGDCGAVYKQHAPLVNACRPPGEWQNLDVIFRTARRNSTQVATPARLTALLNGQVIHNNVDLVAATEGALDVVAERPGPLRLQDHGDPVRFRAIWLLPLPAQGADTYMG